MGDLSSPICLLMNTRANLYHFLAEALSDPPEWLSYSGNSWPIYDLAVDASRFSASARNAVLDLNEIPPEAITIRRQRYHAVIYGQGIRQPVMMYESLYKSGRIAGPETFAVEQIYWLNGLTTIESELPDHVSMELAFLAYLVEADVKNGNSRRRERLFLKEHAGDWLVDLGRQLELSRDPVYAPIGRFLAGWISESISPNVRVILSRNLPAIQSQKECTLCGFCTQVCPTRALVMRETDSETGLILSGKLCTGCWKCVDSCEPGALVISPANSRANGDSKREILVSSPRVRCKRCGKPTVSEAEMNYMQKILGQQDWLHECLDCRAMKPEGIQ